jgi:hypothetical protein
MGRRFVMKKILALALIVSSFGLSSAASADEWVNGYTK